MCSEVLPVKGFIIKNCCVYCPSVDSIGISFLITLMYHSGVYIDCANAPFEKNKSLMRKKINYSFYENLNNF